MAINGGPDGDLLGSVARWLAAERNRRWLMIVDNADDSEVFFDSAGSGPTLSKYIPDCSHGALLVTTRNKEVGVKLTKGRGLIEIPEMDKDESKELISKGMEGNIDDETAIEKLTELLEYLPLALAQAAAFMQQNTLSISEYLEIYEEGPETLINLLSVPFEGQGRDNEVPNPVAATWIISFNQIHRTNTRAAEMMCLMACVDRQSVPQVLLRNPDESLLDFKEARGVLIAFSLIHIDRNLDNCSTHRLVHLVLRKWLETRGELILCISAALDLIWERTPDFVDNSWEALAACQPHIQAAVQLASQHKQDNLRKADLLWSACRYHRLRGEYKDSLSLLLQVIEIQKSILGKDHQRSLFVMNELAKLYLLNGQLHEAERLCSETLGTAITALGGLHKLTLKITEQLAEIYSNQGKVTKSVSLILRIIEIAEPSWAEDYQNNSMVKLRKRLYTIYENHGWLDDARKLCLEVMNGCERQLGKDHPDTLMVTRDLAWIYMSSSLWSDAEGPAQRSLELERHRLGSKNPKTFLAAANLARVYRKVGKVDKGLQLEDEVLKLATGENPDILIALNVIGWNSLECKEYFRAETVWLQMHALQRKALGEDHFKTLDTLENISLAFYRQGRYDDSLKLALDAYNAKRRTLTEHHTSFLDSLFCLAILHDINGRYDDASNFASQLYEAQIRLYGQDHKYTHDSMELLAGIYFRQGQYEKAEELTSLLWHVRRAMLGPNHQDTLKAMGSMAVVSSEQVRRRKEEDSFIAYTTTLHRKLGDGVIELLWYGEFLPLAYPRQHYDLEVEQLLAEAVAFVPLPEDVEAVDELLGGSSSDRERNNEPETIDTLDGVNG